MKPLERLFSHPACEIYFNEDFHLIQTVWNAVEVNSKEFRLILNNTSKALRIRKVNAVIADVRRMHPLLVEDQRWLLEDWYPRALKDGFQYQGLVITPESYNDLAIKKLIQENDGYQVTTHYFTTINEALGWVREMVESA